MVTVRPRIPTRLKSRSNVNNINTISPLTPITSAPSSTYPAPPPPTSAPKSSPGLKRTMTSPATGGLVLKTQVVKARNLAPKDKSGLSDPYLVLTLGDSKSTTVSIPKSLHPEWNETIELPITGAQGLLLEVVCWDKDRIGKDYMGEFDVPLEEVFTQGAVTSEPIWYPLESRKTGKKKSLVTGEVLLGFTIYDPIHTSATPQQILQKLTGLAASSSDPDNENLDQPLSHTESFGPDEDDDDDETTTPEESDPNRTETSEKRKRRLKIAKIKRRATQRAYEFSGLSDLAGILFLEISKVTDLPPERNMTRTSFDMDPFVVTSLGKKTYKTKVIRHNLNPVYDEKLVFQVLKHETNYSLSFTIVDRDKLSGNDFIGTADFPLERATSVAAEADPKTGLYPLKEPESNGQSTENAGSESKKSRFRIPLSRSSSAQSLSRLSPKGSLHKSTSQTSLNGSQLTDTSTAPTSYPGGQDTLAPPMGNLNLNSSSNDDATLKYFALPINMKNKDRWEDKHKPVVHINVKYLPYRALRQQFWRAMLRQYDADDSGYMSQVELTTMLDTLGSTLHESTIDGFFKRFEAENDFGELALTYDQSVICLEDWLQSVEERKGSWRSTASAAAGLFSKRTADRNGSGTPSVAATPAEETQDPIKTQQMHHEYHGTPGEEGETIDANDLADERGEEHIVEIRECPICHQPRLAKKSDADIITHIATCASQDWRQVNNIVMAGFVTSSQAQRKWYSKVINKIGYGGYKLGANSANILVQDRVTGQINEERMSVYVRLGIRLLYKGLKSRDMEKRRIRKLLRSMSFKQGRKFDDPASAAEIQSFVNFHQLDMSEVLLPVEQFKNFNEFFYRALKPDARPCSAPDRPEIVTSPADCRSVVFNKMTEAQSIWVKGREFSIERLFGDAYPEDAKRYANGGALAIFRLAPQDYHRFHIPVDGIMGEPKLIEGEYYTVNPMAIRSALDVYGENIRVLVPIESEKHGRVMVICVGAMMVGSTIITRKAGDRVSRAEELGYFKFGGSTLLVLFEPGRVNFDDDLVDNSNGALETLIRVGMSIGHSPDELPHTPDMRKDAENVTQAEKAEAQRKIAGSIVPEDSNWGPDMASMK